MLPVSGSEVSTVQKAAREQIECTIERVATKTMARWPRVGRVPYQALPIPLLRYFAYKFRAREKVRKGEGEPGDEAIVD